MYTQDQFEYLKNTCKTSTYELNTTINNNVLEIHLKSTPIYKQYRRYSLNTKFEGLQESLRQKFQNLKNFQAFLSNSNNLNVNLQTGVIQLIMSISLFNGKSITSKLGQIKLKQNIFDSKKCLQHIFDLSQSKNLVNQNTLRNVIKQMGNLLKIMFRKVEKMQIRGLDQGQSGKQIVSFHSNNPNTKTSSIENTIRSEKHTTRRKYYSFNQEGQFQLPPQKYHKNSKMNPFAQNQQLQNWKKEITGKINYLTQKSLKNVDQFNVKLQQLKNQLLYEINQNTNKQIKQKKQMDQIFFQSTNIRNRSPSKPKIINRKNILNQQKQDSNSHMSLSPNKSFKNIRMQNNLCNSVNKIISRSSSRNILLPQQKNVNLQEKINKVENQFRQFSNVIMNKILNLGSSHQLFQDKLKKVVEQLDIRIQQRIIEEGIKQVRDRIVDTTQPFFQQFILRGTQIQYNGEDSENTMLLGRIKISEKNTYSIKIVKTLVSNIQIGIVDSKYRNNRDCLNLPNFLLYVGWSSTIYEGPNDMKYKQGEAIKQGDIITVIANTQTGQMQWIVKGEVRAKYTYQKLKDKSINWVPMIRFYDRGDIISWVTDKMLHL